MPELLSCGSILDSTIIKVPHHGSNVEKEESYFFQAVSPQVAVITVSKNNRFGFPAKETLQRLEKVGAQIYKTSDSGAVTISTDGQEVWVETMIGAEAGIYKRAQAIPGHRYQIEAWGKHVRSESPVELLLGVDLAGGEDW